MPAILRLCSALRKVRNGMCRGRRNPDSSKDISIVEESNDRNPTPIPTETGRVLKSILKPTFQAAPEESLSKNIVLLSQPASANAVSIEVLPAEVITEVLSHLDDYTDLINTICTSKHMYWVFKGAPVMIQTRVTLNGIEPEALNIALAAFLCPEKDILPAEYKGPVPADEGGLREAIRPYMLRHVEQYLDPTHKFPFPTVPSDIAKFYNLCKTTKFIIKRLVSRSLHYNKMALSRTDLFPPGTGVALTQQEKAALETALYRYDFMARVFGLAGGADFGLVPRRWVRRIFADLDPIEMQQLITVDNWILYDYRIWERLFEDRFIEEVLEAGEPLKARRASSTSTPAPTSNHSPVVNARKAFLQEAAETAMPHLCGPPRWSNERWASDRFAAALQSHGLPLYKAMCSASPMNRHAMFNYCHQAFEDTPNDFLGWGILDYHKHISKPPSSWFKHMDEKKMFPNTFVEEYILILRRHKIDMLGEDLFYLLLTGWWFWGDDRLENMSFENHQIFAELETHQSLEKGLKKFAADSKAIRNTAPKMPRDRISRHAELPFNAWLDIVNKYGILASPVPPVSDSNTIVEPYLVVE
ncbi:hypothetical protein F5Y19DRAFT_479205 [Xylariaceae sp. FL1651]|nr:hypothetical protein F5Y19DRAFT_479205 [Xylariaceae sp. FL1651]